MNGELNRVTYWNCLPTSCPENQKKGNYANKHQFTINGKQPLYVNLSDALCIIVIMATFKAALQ